jgi:hypothetical protein
MFQIRSKSFHSCQGIADRTGERRFSGYSGKLGMEPGFEIVEDRLGLPIRQPSLASPAIWSTAQL